MRCRGVGSVASAAAGPRLVGLAAASLLLGMLGGCGEEEGATPQPTLPAESTPEATEPPDVTPFPGGGVQPGADLAPEHTVVVTETGAWHLSPPGGPWDAMAGELTVTEHVDGAEEPSCERIFALTGSISVEGACSGCLITLDVLHRLTESTGQCVGADTPQGQEVRKEGFLEADRAILLDYEGSGVWLPWYDATRAADVITLQWTRDFGYFPPDEDE